MPPQWEIDAVQKRIVTLNSHNVKKSVCFAEKSSKESFLYRHASCRNICLDISFHVCDNTQHAESLS